MRNLKQESQLSGGGESVIAYRSVIKSEAQNSLIGCIVQPVGSILVTSHVDNLMRAN